MNNRLHQTRWYKQWAQDSEFKEVRSLLERIETMLLEGTAAVKNRDQDTLNYTQRSYSSTCFSCGQLGRIARNYQVFIFRCDGNTEKGHCQKEKNGRVAGRRQETRTALLGRPIKKKANTKEGVVRLFGESSPNVQCQVETTVTKFIFDTASKVTPMLESVLRNRNENIPFNVSEAHAHT